MTLSGLPALPLILFALAAASLLVLGSVLARRLRAVPILIPAQGHGKMLPLMQAAATVLQRAQRERMVIATVADASSNGAAQWFARSIASVVPLYRRNETGAFAKLDSAADIGSDTEALYIRKQDYPAYLRWARSMQ